MMTPVVALAIDVAPRGGQVSALWLCPNEAKYAFLLAHGAGAGMRHVFLEAFAQAAAERGVATLRYQFPYMERGGAIPDRHPVLEATVRAALARGRALAPSLPWLAGGKSMGGRMTSQACARLPLDGVFGLCFLGFPLHPSGRPERTRAVHLGDVQLPMLFLQGERDQLAQLALIRAVCDDLGERATLHVVAAADHGFKAPKKGRVHGVVEELLDALVAWADACIKAAD
jgi:predicted alpha/beta-hydrolase family hydrolase